MKPEDNSLVTTVNTELSTAEHSQLHYYNSVAEAFLAQTSVQNAKADISEQNKIGIVLPILFAQTKLSLLAERIIHAVLSMIKPTDLPNRVYRFGIDRFCEIYGLSSNKNYDGLRAALRELRDDVELPIGQGRGTGWISTWQLTDSEIQITFDPALLPLYQKELSGRYKLINVKNFVYAYTFKMYEMFTMELNGNPSCVFYKDLAELKEWLQVSLKYKSYADFKRRVLDPVVSDINGVKFRENSKINSENNMCNINISYEEVRKGRSVLGLKFTVTTIREDSPDYEKISIDPFYENLSEEGQQAYTMLRDYYHVARSAIVNCVNTYNEQTMIDITVKLQNKFMDEKFVTEFKKKGGKLGAYAATCLRNGNMEGRRTMAIANTTIDVVAVDAKRKAALNKLQELGVTENYINDIKFDASKSTEFLEYVLKYYDKSVKAGRTLNGGWLRTVIENGQTSFEAEVQSEQASASSTVDLESVKEQFEAKRAAELEKQEKINKKIKADSIIKETIMNFAVSSPKADILKLETIDSLPDFSRRYLENRFNRSEINSVNLLELLNESAFYSVFARLYNEKYGATQQSVF